MATEDRSTRPEPTRRTSLAPLVPVAVLLLAGVLAGYALPLPVGWWAMLGGAAVTAAGVGLVFRRVRPVATLGLACAILALGAVRMHLAWRAVPADHIARCTSATPTLATLRGRVDSVPQIYQPKVEMGYQPGPRLGFILQAHALKTRDGFHPCSGAVRVNIDEPYVHLQPGDEVELLGWLGRFQEAANPGEYDAARAAEIRGLRAIFRVQSADGVTTLQPARQGLLQRLRNRLRTVARQRLMDIGDVQSGRIVSALVLGERSPALRDLNDTMRRAGIAHFLSISGLHLGIFLGFLYWLCRLMTLSTRSAALVVLVALCGYLLLAEPRPPLLRSAVMAGALAVAAWLGRPYAAINALAAALCVLLVLDPRQILTPGLHLSFIIVGGLILFGPQVRTLLFGRWIRRRGLMVFRHRSRWKRWLYFNAADGTMQAVSLSITAYLLAAPLAAAHFGLFSPYAAFLSILLLPLVVAILIPGYLSLALAWLVPNLSTALAELAGLPARGLSLLVSTMEALPGLSIPLRPFGVLWVLVCYLCLLAILWSLQRPGRRILALFAVGVLVLATAWTQRTHRPERGAELHMLAVGNGQCAVLQMPSGKTVLLDAGTRSGFDVYDRVLEPFLRHQRLPAVEEAFLSHANTDHYNALPGLLADAPPRCVHAPPQFIHSPSRGAERLRNQTHSAGAEFRPLRRGDVLHLDGQTTMTVLWPPNDQPASPANDTSLVLRIRCGNRSLLTTGDIGEDVHRALLADPSQLRADILVLPHHGGWVETLPALVEAVDPKIVLVSRSSPPYGPTIRPAEIETFYKRLRRKRRVYTTGQVGWCGVQFGEAGLSVETMRDRSLASDAAGG